MVVFGIDQSYNSSGLVIMDSGNIIQCECFKVNKNNNRFGQAHEVAMYISSIINIYKPDIIAIEGLAFGMRGNVTRDLAGLQFLIVAHIQEVLKQEVVIVAPLTVKKFATGNGRAKKNEIMEALPLDVHDKFSALGVKKTTGLADLADAYFIGKYAEDQYNKKKK